MTTRGPTTSAQPCVTPNPGERTTTRPSVRTPPNPHARRQRLLRRKIKAHHHGVARPIAATHTPQAVTSLVNPVIGKLFAGHAGIRFVFYAEKRYVVFCVFGWRGVYIRGCWAAHTGSTLNLESNYSEKLRLLKRHKHKYKYKHKRTSHQNGYYHLLHRICMIPRPPNFRDEQCLQSRFSEALALF